MKSNTRSLLCARSAPAAEKEEKPVKKHEHADDGAADVYAGEKPREEQPHACGRHVLRASGEKYQQRARGGGKPRTAQHSGEEHGSSGGGGNVLRPAPPDAPGDKYVHTQRQPRGQRHYKGHDLAVGADGGVVKIADDGGVGGVEELLYDAAERYGKREQLRILNSVLVVHIIDI